MRDPFTKPCPLGSAPYWLTDDPYLIDIHHRLVLKLEALHNLQGRFVPPENSRQRSWHNTKEISK
jgi:hypothetical protein